MGRYPLQSLTRSPTFKQHFLNQKPRSHTVREFYFCTILQQTKNLNMISALLKPPERLSLPVHIWWTGACLTLPQEVPIIYFTSAEGE